jgi:predicted RNA-binding Zn ribbon-like protein
VLLAPVLWSAGDLLAGPRLDRVRRCANPECGWLFFDDSRAGKRRWCSMQACGNRAKARRHYHRSREA